MELAQVPVAAPGTGLGGSTQSPARFFSVPLCHLESHSRLQ